MGTFDDIELEWKGRRYKIPASRVMGAIARIEDVVTLLELQRYGANQNLPMAKIAMAFGAVLRYAGASVTDEDIYNGIFDGDGQEAIAEAIVVLLQMMLPRHLKLNQETPEGNSPAPAQSGAAPRSSKKSTKRRSAKPAS